MVKLSSASQALASAGRRYFGEKFDESNEILKKAFALHLSRNDVTTWRMDKDTEDFEFIGSDDNPIQERVSRLDKMIHRNVYYAGIRQNPKIGMMITYWELGMGEWMDQCKAVSPLMLSTQSEREMIPLKDGTVLVVEDDRQELALKSEQERKEDLESYGKRDMLPFGMIVYDWVVSDDKFVSPAYVAMFSGGNQMMMDSKKQIAESYSADFFKTKLGDKH